MKLKSLTLGLSFSCLLASCNEDVRDIMKKTYNKCQSIQSGYYEMTMTNAKDASLHSYTCNFKKIKGDSLFSSLFHYKEYQKGQYKGDVFYTGNEIVTIDAKDSTATVMSKVKWERDIKAYSGTYHLYSPLTNRKSSPLPIDSDFLDGKHTFKFIGEENINNVICYHIQVNEIPENEIASPIKTLKLEFQFWISKADYIPIQFSLTVEGLQNNDTLYQYNMYLLTKFELNTFKDTNIFTLQSIPSEYRIKDYTPFQEFDPLPIGTVAPKWELISLKNEKIGLTEFKNKIVLIDFFHKSCYPCIQSLPGLQSLHDKFYHKGLRIVGIDPIDESKSDLAAFLEKQGVTYTVLLEGEDVAKDYRVTGYPTIYVIDKNGKIIFTELGYDKDLEKKVEELILKNL